MRHKIKKITLSYVFFLLIAFLFPAMSCAVLVVQTKIVSGKIVQKFENHSVELDDGKVYQPSRDGLVINLQDGEPVTLRCIVEDSRGNVFFEFAPGLNSLKEFTPEYPIKNDTQK